MKKFQKIDNDLFKPIPESKMNVIKGSGTDITVSDLYWSGPHGGVDIGDVDGVKNI